MTDASFTWVCVGKRLLELRTFFLHPSYEEVSSGSYEKFVEIFFRTMKYRRNLFSWIVGWLGGLYPQPEFVRFVFFHQREIEPTHFLRVEMWICNPFFVLNRMRSIFHCNFFLNYRIIHNSVSGGYSMALTSPFWIITKLTDFKGMFLNFSYKPVASL